MYIYIYRGAVACGLERKGLVAALDLYNSEGACFPSIHYILYLIARY